MDSAVPHMLPQIPYLPQASIYQSDDAFAQYNAQFRFYEAGYLLSPLQTQNLSNQMSLSEYSATSFNFPPESATPTSAGPSEAGSMFFNDAVSASGSSSNPDSDTSPPLSPMVTIEQPCSLSPIATDRRPSHSSSEGRGRSRHAAEHPYLRLQNKKANSPEVKKRNSRRIWTHALEKYVFTPHEIASLGITHRRTIYSASLEAHIDRLHCQLLAMNLFPIDVGELQPYKGLNCKIAKALLAGLQNDYVQVRTGLLEIQRATESAYAFVAQSQADVGAEL